MKKTIKWLVPILILTTISCSYFTRRTLSPDEYFLYVTNPENGLVQKASDDLYSYELQYMPPEELAFISSKGSSDIKSDYEKYLAEPSNNLTFKLKIFSTDKQTDPLEFKSGNSDEQFQRLGYFTSAISEDGLLVFDKDTLTCKLAMLERTYKTSPYLTILFQFDNSKSISKDFNFILDNKVSGVKNIFKYKISDLNTPKIKI